MNLINKSKEKANYWNLYVAVLIGCVGAVVALSVALTIFLVSVSSDVFGLFHVPIEKKNKAAFYEQGYSWILKTECGDCKTPCHVDKKSKEGFTCNGISSKFNNNFYAFLINKVYASEVNLDKEFADRYYTKYFKPFDKCQFNVAMHLTDAAILHGTRRAINLFQQSHSIVANGKFRNIEQAVCNHAWNKKAFLSQRLKVLKKSKNAKTHYKGWVARINKLKKEF